jgi:queuosine precursor transporter
MVELQFSKLLAGVRFSYPAPDDNGNFTSLCSETRCRYGVFEVAALDTFHPPFSYLPAGIETSLRPSVLYSVHPPLIMTTKTHKFLPLLSGLFVAALLISVSIAGKLFVLGPFTLSASVLLFPLVFLFNDLLTEVYGYSASRQVIWTGFVAELLLALSYSVTVALPWPDFFQNQQAYEVVLGMGPRIVLASLSAYFVGEFCNSFTLAKMKVFSEGRNIRIRYVASTAVGEAADSLVFYPIAFLGLIPLSELPMLIVSTWLVKVLWEVIALPVSIPLTTWLKRVENEDYYDTATNFNPFKIPG